MILVHHVGATRMVLFKLRADWCVLEMAFKYFARAADQVDAVRCLCELLSAWMTTTTFLFKAVVGVDAH